MLKCISEIMTQVRCSLNLIVTSLLLISDNRLPFALDKLERLESNGTSFNALPMSPLTEVVHRTSHIQSPVVDLTRFEVASRISDILENDILRMLSSVKLMIYMISNCVRHLMLSYVLVE